MQTDTRKLHVHVKVKRPTDCALAIDCARFVADTAREWSAGLTQLTSVFVFTVAELGEDLLCEVQAEVVGLPSTSKALSLLGQTWFEDQIELARIRASVRAEKARRAANARWGTDDEQRGDK